MSDYNAGNIRVLEGLDAVRLRPGMYIGTTGVKGLHHILWEIVDNSIDEVANGFATSVTVTVHADGSASVEDDGRGMRAVSSIRATIRIRADFTASARRSRTRFRNGSKSKYSKTARPTAWSSSQRK